MSGAATGVGALLAGRDDELAAVLNAVGAAVSAAGVAAVAVEGPAGIGKTALVTAAAARLGADGWQVRTGSAREMEEHEPFGVVSGVMGIRPGGPGAELLPVLASTAADDHSVSAGRIQEDLLRHVDRLATDRPLMLVVDDLHWADAGSLTFLSRLLRESAGRSVAVLMTVRPARPPEVEALLGMLERLPGAVRMRLGPLSPQAAHELARRLAGAPLAARVSARVARAGGNPLLVTELVRTLSAHGALGRRDDGYVEVVEEGWAEPVGSAVAGRLRFLSAPARDTLALAAVLGSRFAVADLAVLAGRPAAVLWGDLRELLAADMLREDADRLAFDHDLLREAAYRSLPEAVRVALHAEAAEALERSGAPAIAVAEHVIRSAPSGDSQALVRLQRGAQEACRRAPAVAVQLLDHALARAHRLSPERRDLEADRVLALQAAGRHAEVRDAAETLLTAGVCGPRDGELWTALLASSLAAGDLDVLDRVDAALASGTLSAEQAGLLAAYRPLTEADHLTPEATAAWARLGPTFYRDPLTAERRAAESARLARRTGAAAAESLALLAGSLALDGRADFEAAVALGRRAVALAEATGTREAYTGFPHARLADALEQADRAEEAVEVLHRGRLAADELGDANHLQLLHAAAGMVAFRCGRWEDALAELAAGLTLAESIDARPWVEAFTIPAQVALFRGDLESATRLVERAERLGAAGVPALDVGRTGAMGALLLERRESSKAALTALATVWDDLGTVGVRKAQLRIAPDLARLARAAGETGLAEQAADVADSLAAQPGAPVWVRAAARHARGLADDDADALVEAHTLLLPVPRPFERARCATDAAAALARSDRRDLARRYAEQALAGLADLQAAGELQRARAVLREAGLGLGTRGPRARPRTGWAALTETEVKVARLVARRLSNPEIADLLFISRRTVQTHVSHILAKLGMTSRSELVSAHAHGRLEPGE